MKCGQFTVHGHGVGELLIFSEQQRVLLVDNVPQLVDLLLLLLCADLLLHMYGPQLMV